MKKRLSIIALILVLLGTPAIALASNISGAQYWAVIQISNNSTATTNVATTCNISTQNLIDGNYLNAQANDCAMRTSSGADIPFMPSVNASYPWCLWVPSIGADSYQSDILYTANSTGGEIRYFPADGGMTTPDSDTLELGDNFTITQKGWVQTTFTDNYSDRNLVYKKGAFKTYISAAENITSALLLNFLNYTEVDASNRLTVTSTKATAIDADRDIDVYLYRDFGANYFDALNVEFEIYTDDAILINSTAGIAFTNTLGTYNNWVVTDLSVMSFSAGSPNFNLNLCRGNDTAVFTYAATTDTPYYCTLTRPAGGDIVTLKIYSDSARTTLLDTLAAAGFGTTKWRYVYGFVNRNSATADKDWDGYIQDLDLGFDVDVISVTASEVSSANHTVTTMLVSDNLTIWIDGLEKDDILCTDNVTDNSENWTFVENYSMLYLEYQKIWIGGTLQQHIEWEYDTVFTDLSEKNHDATPTFRGESSDLDVSAEMISFQPIAEAQAPDYILGEAPDFITPTSNVTSTFTTTPATGDFPLAGVITAVASATDTPTPAQLPLLIIAIFVILTASLSVSATMRRYGSGSILIKILIICAVMGIFIALKNFSIDFWMLVVFVIIAVALAMGSRQIGWQ